MLRWTSIPSGKGRGGGEGEVEILPVTQCCGNRDRLQGYGLFVRRRLYYIALVLKVISLKLFLDQS